MTFDAFVSAPCNAPALEAALHAAVDPGSGALYLFGPAGAGKTHLLRAIEHRIASTRPELSLIRVNADVFLAQAVHAGLRSRREEFEETYRQADVLLLDDLQFLEDKETAWSVVQNICREFIQQDRLVVVTSDHPPLDPFFSRFQAIPMDTPDALACRQIIEAMAQGMDLTLAPEVVDLVADSAQGNLCRGKGILKRLLAFRDLMDLPPTPENTARILADFRN